MRQVKAKRMNRIVIAIALMLSLVAVGNFSAGRTVSASTTFVVTNKNDSGPGSLRQAILDANANLGADTISFYEWVFYPGQKNTINLETASAEDASSALVVSDNVTIIGRGANLLTVQRSTEPGTPDFRIF